MRHRTRMIILGMGILIALCLVALQNALAADDPPTIYLVEEDHRSVSGQLSQAERLFELYFSNAVRDILLEGYVGNTIPVGGLMALLPDGVRDFVHENAFGSRMLSNYMPEVVPASQSRRFSIAFPEFAQANVSAAEFVASILPVRLHPGETDQTYLRWDKFEPSLCENLDKRIREQAPKDASRLGSADAQELKARFESLRAMSSYDSRYEGNYSPHMTCADHALAVSAAGVARAWRMAVRALRPLRRPVSTMEQRAA